VLLLIGVLGTPARATPPDSSHSTVTPLCRGADRLALLVRTHSNQGMHFVSAVDLGLVLLDTGAETAEAVLLAGIHDSLLDLQEPGQLPDRRRSSAPLDLGRQLQTWGTEDCGPLPRLWLPDTDSGSLDPRVQPPTPETPLRLALHLGDRHRALGPARLLAPEAGWSGPVSPAGWALEPADPDDLHLSPGRPVVLETTVAVPVEVREPVYSSTVFAVYDRAHFDAAQGWLVNATGLDRHRAGRHREAAAWFALAAQLDPANPTPRFNLACAWARTGDAGRTATALLALRDTPGMAAKVAADADFDAVRDTPELRAAVAELD
jgi:hypothetical protein